MKSKFFTLLLISSLFVGCTTKIYKEPQKGDVTSVSFMDVGGQNSVFVVPLLNGSEQSRELVQYKKNSQNKVVVAVGKPIIFLYRFATLLKECEIKFRVTPRKNVSYLSVMHQNEHRCLFRLEGYYEGKKIDVREDYLNMEHET
jgi:hypothetical protein